MKCKSLYRGLFAMHVEAKKEYTMAYSREQAIVVMTKRLAEKQGVKPQVISGWLEAHPNSWEVKLEIEWKEFES
jgi:hypothetical protein